MCCASLPSNLPWIRTLLIAGQNVHPAYAKEMRQLAGHLPAHVTVEFLGELTLEAKAAMWHRCDIACFPSRIAEVRALAAQYANAWQLPSMSSLGYPQMGAVLRGEVSLTEAAQQIKHHTHRFVRHQYAWFRPADSRIEIETHAVLQVRGAGFLCSTSWRT